MSAAHTEKITLIFCAYKNHSKENTTTIICDILNNSPGNFVIEIKQISWSCPDPFFSKINIQIQSGSEKIASILQDIQCWSCPCSPLLFCRGGTGSGVQESTPAGFCVFVSDPDRTRSQKFGKNRTRIRSHFSISAVAVEFRQYLCGHCLSKNVGKLRLDRWL